MIVLDGHQFAPGTIIDLVVCPEMDACTTVSEMLSEVERLVIIDTQGHFYRKYSGQQASNIEYYFISQNGKFLAMMESLALRKRTDMKNGRDSKDFIIIIDSITFVVDSTEVAVQQAAGMIWRVIYNTAATVITINHYKIQGTLSKTNLVPRMGIYWPYFINYQVLFSIKEGKVVHSIEEKQGTSRNQQPNNSKY